MISSSWKHEELWMTKKDHHYFFEISQIPKRTRYEKLSKQHNQCLKYNFRDYFDIIVQTQMCVQFHP